MLATMVKVMTQKNSVRISVAMVLDGLREQCELVAETKRRCLDLTEERNEMMVELKAAGVPDSKIVRITGLSLSMVTKITAGARRGSLAF